MLWKKFHRENVPIARKRRYSSLFPRPSPLACFLLIIDWTELTSVILFNQ